MFLFYNQKTQSNIGASRGGLTNANTAANQAETGVLDFIFPMEEDSTLSVRVTSLTADTTMVTRTFQTYMIIQEL